MGDERSSKSNKNKWIVMVFMGADNLPEEPDLTDAAARDIEEMQKVVDLYPGSKSLSLVYQLHGKDSVTRRRVQPNGAGRVEDATDHLRDVTDGGALVDFVEWTWRQVRRDPDDHVMLILWGHAHRFAIGAHEGLRGLDALSFAQLPEVLERAGLVGELDILGFDACDASTIEMAVELAPVASYLLASQTTMPIPGFPYDRILDRLAKSEGRLMGPAETGTWIVRRFCEHYSADDRTREAVSLTLLDLQRVGSVAARTEQLARALVEAVADAEDDDGLVRALFQRSQIVASAQKPFVDAADLCLNLLLNCRNVDVKASAQALGDLLLSPGPVPRHRSEVGAGRPFVVEHGGNSCITARLNGVSLYAPHVTGPGVDDLSQERYDALQFGTGTWRNLVVTLAGA